MQSIEGKVLLIGDSVSTIPQDLEEHSYTVVRLSALEALPKTEPSGNDFDDMGVDCGRQSADWSDERDRCCIYLHTSGTTGIIFELDQSHYDIGTDYHNHRTSEANRICTHSCVFLLHYCRGGSPVSGRRGVLHSDAVVPCTWDLIHTALLKLIIWSGRRLCHVISQYHRRRRDRHVP